MLLVGAIGLGACSPCEELAEWIVESQKGDGALVNVGHSAPFAEIVDFYQDRVDSSGLEVLSKIETPSPPSVTWALSEGNRAHGITVTDTGDSVETSLVVSDS